MTLVTAAKRLIGIVAFLLVAGWPGLAHAQLAAGTKWLRTDAQGKGIVLTVEACCNGGLRLIYQLPPMGTEPATKLTVDSPMDGSEVPTLVGGKPSGQTMAAKRVDDRHYSAIVKVGGKPLGTYNGAVSADGKTMTVEGLVQGAGKVEKVTEMWVRQ